MTHDILQSDIILATRLRGDQRPDEEIIQALVHRGVDPARAAKLLDDLHNGRKPEAQPPLPSEITMTRRSRSKSAEREAGGEFVQPFSRSRSPPLSRDATSLPGGKNAALGQGSGRSLPRPGSLAAVGIVLFKRVHSGNDALDEHAD